MKNNEHMATIAEASELLGWDVKSLREAVRQGKVTFATAIKGSGSKDIFLVDRKTLDKCVRGEKELFRG